MSVSPFAHDFALDRFQIEAGRAIAAGENVLVAAPTGSGKTVVGEMAVADALARGGRAFYTAPIKALSNQKFNDLRAVLGHARVGLLTGDHSLHPDAPVVVMTTEVLRNMVYAGSTALDQLLWVVLDEVHFLQDTYRGPVWEEVLIHTPAHVRFVCLSATVSNAAELGDWITSLRGPTSTVVEHHRPVELDPLYLVGDRHAEQDHLIPLLDDGRPNPQGSRFDSDEAPAARGGPRPRRRFRTPRRVEVVDRLAEEQLLPAIVFVFSRMGCEEAVAACREAGVRLSTPEEAARIREIADRHGLVLADGDLDVLGFDLWRETLAMGLAAHHAGMIPAFREAVEECFVQGLVKVVFATETLALGINMPARSVVIERLTKFTGDGHDMLTPAQFTQLTGRAGRRGIDDRGAAVVLWSPFVAFVRVAELAASREFTLQSVFRPSYNMAANLVGRLSRPEAHRVLARSFAQFQADRGVTRLRARRDQRAADLEALDAEGSTMLSAAGMKGVEDYVRLAELEASARRALRGSPQDIEASVASLRPGDVVELDSGKGPRRVVVVSVANRRREVRVEVVGAQGRLRRLDPSTLGSRLAPVGHVELPVPYVPKDPEFRRQAAARLKRVDPRRSRPSVGAEGEADRRWREAAENLEAHPLHHHPAREELLRWERRRLRLVREVASLDRQISQKGTDLVGRFDRVVTVLEHFEQVRDWQLTEHGQRLRRIYHECDLLVSLALADGLLDGLDAADTAALVSCLTHEHRSADAPPPPRLPNGELHRRFARLEALAQSLQVQERAARLGETRAPSAGFALSAHRWASGQPFEQALEEEMSGGDFVRNARSLIDLLRQLRDVAPGEVGRTCSRAAELLRRDVVEAGGGPA